VIAVKNDMAERSGSGGIAACCDPMPISLLALSAQQHSLQTRTKIALTQYPMRQIIATSTVQM
jgi:hypothetical protein